MAEKFIRIKGDSAVNLRYVRFATVEPYNTKGMLGQQRWKIVVKFEDAGTWNAVEDGFIKKESALTRMEELFNLDKIIFE